MPSLDVTIRSVEAGAAVRRSVFAAWVAGCGFVALGLSCYQLAYQDDTYITLRYVDNWLRTGELTWHRALPPADGFTSVGHVLLLAASGFVGLDLITANSLWSAGAFASILWLLVRAARQRGISPVLQGLGVALLCINGGLTYWLFRGLEGVLFSAAVFALYCSCEDVLRSKRLGWGFALSLLACALLRPEGLLISVGVLGYTMAAVRRQGEHLGYAWALLSAAVASLCAGLLLWRLSRFGHPLPSTYYAKRAADWTLELRDGLHYLWLFFALHGGALLLLPLMSIVQRPRAAPLQGPSLRWLFILGLLGLVLLAGGDPFPQMRFMLPLWPLLVLEALDRFAQGGRVRRSFVAGLLIVHALSQFTVKLSLPFDEATLGARVVWADPWRRVRSGLAGLTRRPLPFSVARLQHTRSAIAATRLGQLLRPDAVVASNDIGMWAFYSRLPMLDVFGLNDTRIAHMDKPQGVANRWGVPRFDDAVKRRPEAIVLNLPRLTAMAAASLDLRSLTLPGYQALFGYPPPVDLYLLSLAYTCASVPQQGLYLNFLLRRDVVDDIWQSRPEGLQLRECLRRGVQPSTPTRAQDGAGRPWEFRSTPEGTLRATLAFEGAGPAAEDLKGLLLSAPSAAVGVDGSLEVYVHGMWSTAWRIRKAYGAQGGWGAWQPLPGASIQGAPAAIAGGAGDTELFAWGTDGALWHAAVPAQASDLRWRRLDGELRSSPAVVRHRDGSLEVFAYTPAGLQGRRRRRDTAGWSAWAPVGRPALAESGLPQRCPAWFPCPTPVLRTLVGGGLELRVTTIRAETFVANRAPDGTWSGFRQVRHSARSRSAARALGAVSGHGGSSASW